MIAVRGEQGGNSPSRDISEGEDTTLRMISIDFDFDLVLHVHGQSRCRIGQWTCQSFPAASVDIDRHACYRYTLRIQYNSGCLLCLIAARPLPPIASHRADQPP